MIILAWAIVGVVALLILIAIGVAIKEDLEEVLIPIGVIAFVIILAWAIAYILLHSTKGAVQ